MDHLFKLHRILRICAIIFITTATIIIIIAVIWYLLFVIITCIIIYRYYYYYCWFSYFFFHREHFLQMFVHGVTPGQPLVLMVKQDEKGLALKDAVLKKCPSIPSSFILMHQGRKVIKKYGNCRGVIWLASK